jgi:hypothetical protein
VRVRFTPEARLSIREKPLFAEELAAMIARLRDGVDANRQRFAVRHGQMRTR